jgi:succinate-acetate transporter protein
VSVPAQVELRPLASPLALGFFGLAAGTFVLAGLQLGWVEPAESKQVAFCILAFTVPLQAVASIVAFLARDGAVATGMGLLAGIWTAVGVVTATGEPGSTSDALGLFLLVAGLSMWAPASAAAATKLVPAVVLFTAGARFVVAGLFQLTAAEAWEDASGVVGIVLAALAVYAAYAALFDDVLDESPLPLGRRKPVAGEPGTRKGL